MLDKHWSEKFISRFLSDSERYEFLGHPGEVADYFPSHRSRRQAIGNAYAVPQVMSVIIPMIEAAVHTGALKSDVQQRKLNMNELASLSFLDADVDTTALTIASVKHQVQYRAARKRRRVS